MKILLFSDLHAHPFRSYATILPSGQNSRLADAVHVIAQVHQHAVNVDADLVLFGGDMFHVRKTISVPAFNAVYEAMAKFAVDKIPVVMIHGNHDQADKQGDQYSIYAFKSFLTVVDQPGWTVVRGRQQEYAIMAVPYTENLQHLRSVVNEEGPDELFRLFLGHLGLQGAVVGADFVYANPHDPTIDDLRPQQFDALFLGHFHRHQQVAENGWYIGAPMQHNWGDRDDMNRGCLVYDTAERTIQRIPLRAPSFVLLDEEMIDDADTHGAEVCPDDSFVRVVSERLWTAQEREKLRTNLRARTLEIMPPKRAAQVAPRLQVDPSMSASELLDRYIQSGLANTDGLDDGYLLQLGHEILEEVEGQDV